MSRHGGFSIAATDDVYAGYDAAHHEHLVKTGGSDFVARWEKKAQAKANLLSIPPRPPSNRLPRPNEIAGFRHLFSEAGGLPSHKRFSVDGGDPLRPDADEKRLRSLMALLAERMSRTPVWEVDKTNPDNSENPDIPAGYTYLLQLVAHDLVQTSFPLSVLEDTATGVRNDRGYQLKLDTIYGAGPAVCPFAYATGRQPNDARARLRLGEFVNEEDENNKMNPRGRDIPRFDAGEDTTNKRRLADVLVADPRNDDHAILSQLTALFHHLHNGLMDQLPKPSAKDTADSECEATFDAFLCARGAATLIYRNIIRCDLMHKILNPDIYKRYNKEDARFLSDFGAGPQQDRSQAAPPRTPLVPLEFTHGAFRFGHAMVRSRYKINDVQDEFLLTDVLRATSSERPFRMPLGRKWIVRWSNFFDVPNEENRRPQSSMRIGPYLSNGLEDTHLFPAFDVTGQASLIYRDLMSAAFVGLWSVNALVDEIQLRQPELISNCPLLNNKTHRVERLSAWLAQDRRGMTDDDIKTLANDPPLPFFILFEAAMDPDEPAKRGRTLGVLGSIIGAEVIFGALRDDPLLDVGASGTLREALSSLSSRVYAGANHLAVVPEIKTMGELIPFIAQIANLEQADPTFI